MFAYSLTVKYAFQLWSTTISIFYVWPLAKYNWLALLHTFLTYFGFNVLDINWKLLISNNMTTCNTKINISWPELGFFSDTTHWGQSKRHSIDLNYISKYIFKCVSVCMRVCVLCACVCAYVIMYKCIYLYIPFNFFN